MDALTTPADVAAGLGVSVPTEGSRDRAALDIAVRDAAGLVLGYLRRASLDGFTDPASDAVQAVTRRVAQRLWRNPQDWVSASSEGTSHTVDTPRILTGDERAALRPYRARRRGPVLSTPTSPL